MSHVLHSAVKTIKETSKKIDQTDSRIKTMLEKVKYEKIQKFASNETETKKTLHQRKFKKYKNKNLMKPSYVEILRANKTPTRRLSKINNADHKTSHTYRYFNRYRRKLKSLSKIFQTRTSKMTILRTKSK